MASIESDRSDIIRLYFKRSYLMFHNTVSYRKGRFLTLQIGVLVIFLRNMIKENSLVDLTLCVNLFHTLCRSFDLMILPACFHQKHGVLKLHFVMTLPLSLNSKPQYNKNFKVVVFFIRFCFWIMIVKIQVVKAAFN